MSKLFFSLFLLISGIVIAEPVKSMLGADGAEIMGEEGIVPVEYLESSGTQVINVADIFYDFEIDCQSLVAISGNYILGASSSRSLRPTMQSGGCWVFFPGGYISTIEAAARNIISWKDGRIYANGEFLENASKPFTSGVLSLFGYAGSASPRGNRIFSCRLYDALGMMVRDLIPVRIGDEGFMYDRISGELFGNMGIGEFVLGPDKE